MDLPTDINVYVFSIDLFFTYSSITIQVRLMVRGWVDYIYMYNGKVSRVQYKLDKSLIIKYSKKNK